MRTSYPALGPPGQQVPNQPAQVWYVMLVPRFLDLQLAHWQARGLKIRCVTVCEMRQNSDGSVFDICNKVCGKRRQLRWGEILVRLLEWNYLLKVSFRRRFEIPFGSDCTGARWHDDSFALCKGQLSLAPPQLTLGNGTNDTNRSLMLPWEEVTRNITAPGQRKFGFKGFIMKCSFASRVKFAFSNFYFGQFKLVRCQKHSLQWH